ncbi:glycosyltransferase [Candidatus Dojkabacteria bacterium]|jgi:hypothetical protein|nr:glycosyltransferase [Candidatus Dojkabacteria bacterium]
MQQLRIATIGDFQKWHSYYLAGTVQGSILNGHLHYSISIRQGPENIEQQLNYYKPHVLFCHMLFSENLKDIEGDNLNREDLHQVIMKAKRKWGTKIIIQEGDAKLEPRFPYPVDALVDLCLVNSRRYKEFSDILRVPCIHWPYFALNQESINIPNSSFGYNLVFTGNISRRNEGHLHFGRAEFITELSNRIDIKIYPDDKFGNTRFSTAEIAASCNAILGIQHGMHVDGYLDTRPFQYCGAGALYFHSECSAINQFFKPGCHFVQYEHMRPDSFMNKYNYYMEHPELGNKIRQQAFEYTQKYHTAKHRIKMALDVLEGKEPAKIYLKDLGID